MECPKCHSTQSKVNDSRPADNGTAIRRRRECLNCKHRFNTYERIERVPLLVVKRDGTREEFSHDKLLRGIVRAAEKRPISLEQMNQLALEVENQIRETADQEIESAQIGEYIIPLLMELDEVTYIRFASVYRQFHSGESFLNELQRLQARYAAKTDKTKKVGRKEGE